MRPTQSRNSRHPGKMHKSLLLVASLFAGSTVTGILVLGILQAKPLVRGLPDSVSQALPYRQGMMMGQQADRHFIEMMIPHHEGAVKMADLALKLSKRSEIRKLAESIKRDQTREIDQMRSWYKQWYGTNVPPLSAIERTGMRGMHSRMMAMADMTDADLKALETSPDFDKAFIEEMVPHHQMALMMTHTIAASDRPEMRKLANAIVQSQSAEIEQMRQWYSSWYASK
ncbi:DUF305 domain-containing protein [Pseudanabaena sp. PCC 6802]|uniref:DUF305 domain-containing protein n=1 Tax=Pseudanabaena sp. PCC 6802 TaxID=118173 RepID=UPI000685DAA1|nr:DUF305 domain-containing protein [Pseudanabaena sp. PCC 6802]